MNLTNQTLDSIAQSILAAGISGPAAIEGGRLAEAWIREVAEFDLRFPTLAVEAPFFIILEKYTVVVGVMDRIALAGTGPFGQEHKTTKGTTRNWNEDKWLAQIGVGPQISVYGLGLHEGRFVLTPDDVRRFALADHSEVMGNPSWNFFLCQPCVDAPRILVRAITKESPPVIWPTAKKHEIFEIDRERLAQVKEALCLKADVIRAARARGKAPWELTGIQCQDRFHWGGFCEFYEDGCSKRNYPETAPPREPRPGSALEAAQTLLRVPLTDPRVVVLSATSYSDATDCLEKYRRIMLEGRSEDGDSALEIGKAFHAGVSSFYRSQQ